MKYQQIISNMTLEEKCVLLSGKNTWETQDYPHHGVPPLWLSDGPHGLRKQCGAADHLGLNGSEPATCFPTAATVAASWDPALGEQIGRALGEEAASMKVGVLLGPGLNMKRSPLCGRNFEYFSEDPYLAGKMAAGYIRGIQSNGIAACPKHYAVNSQELRRMASDSIVDERALREIYLTGFEIAVKEGHPKTIMSSYNAVNGDYANESEHLLKEILRDDWGFDGAVVTDWGGSNDHTAGVKAGSNLEMPAPGLGSARELIAAVRAGTLDEAVVDARVDELLDVILPVSEALKNAPESFDVDAHHALARRAAEECIVLLKNEDHTLPLAAGTRVAVIGDFAITPRYQGAGSSMVNPTRLDTVKDAMASTGFELVGMAPGFDRSGAADEAKKKEAVDLAKQADAVLLYLGLDEVSESEGLDRASMKMHDNQAELLAAVAGACARVIVVLSAGSAVEMPWLDRAGAVVHGYLGGQAGAGAMLDVIAGKVNPSGHLAETLPLRLEDCSTAKRFPAAARNSEYRESLYIGYRYFNTTGTPVRFPFGFGLSYTTFAYSEIRATRSEVSFTLTNTGSVDGAEVAQLYVAKPDGAVFRPARELKGFARVFLKAGESRNVTIPLDDKAFRYWNVRTNRWEVEGGCYRLLVGANVEDIRLTAEISVEGTNAPDPYEGKALPSYRSGKVQSVPDAEFEALLGRPIPVQPKGFGENSTFSDLNHGRSPIFWIVWAVLTALHRQSIKSGVPNLNVLFIYNMPMRGLAKMTGGMVGKETVDGIVMEVRGFWIIGLVRALVGFVQNLAANGRLKKTLARQAEAAGQKKAQSV